MPSFNLGKAKRNEIQHVSIHIYSGPRGCPEEQVVEHAKSSKELQGKMQEARDLVEESSKSNSHLRCAHRDLGDVRNILEIDTNGHYNKTRYILWREVSFIPGCQTC